MKKGMKNEEEMVKNITGSAPKNGGDVYLSPQNGRVSHNDIIVG